MSQQIVTSNASQTVNGELAVGAATVQLTALLSPIPTSCLRVKIMAPRSSHPVGAANTSDVLVVISTASPANGAGGEAIASDGTRDQYFHVDDPRKIWLIGSHAGDKVEYRIEL